MREEPRPRRRAPAQAQRTPPRFAFLSMLTRRPGRTLLVTAGALLLGGIAVNALFLQSARHPAPFFRQSEARAVEPEAAPVPPSRPADAALLPPVRPASPALERTASTATPASREAARPAPAAAAPSNAGSSTVVPRTEARGDAIAALLREGRPASAPTPPASIPNATPEQTRRIMAVQEALKKLGHSITPDGVAGPGTRAAIEQFERTQKLPVTGQMNPRVVKELSARAGVRIP